MMPLGFNPLHFGELVQEVSTALPMQDSMGTKILKLEEVIGEQLEAKGHIMAEMVAGYVLKCFQSWDPQVSLESMVQGHVAETEEAA
jgi:hypothetical protein